MILRKIRSLHKNQAGYSLIELIAVIAISSIISLGALMANGQVITQTVKNNDFTTANRHVLNAIHWMSRDAQMAQSITGYYLSSDNIGFPVDSHLYLTWITWDNQVFDVVYSLDNEGRLKRTSSVDGGAAHEQLIAQYILSASTNCTWYTTSDNKTSQLTITITGVVGDETGPATVTKQKTVSPRPLIK